MKLSLTWDLNSLYPGQNESQKLKECFKKIEAGIDQLKKNLLERSHLPSVLDLFQTVNMHLRQVHALAYCLVSQNDKDDGAVYMQNRTTTLFASFDALSALLDQWLSDLDHTSFHKLKTEMSNIAFSLEERRKLAYHRLPAKEETLIHDLSVDGYHGWFSLWENLIRNLSFPYQGKHLSFNQISSLLDLPDQNKRKEAFDTIEKTIQPFQGSFAQILNRLAGFRLKICSRRKWDSPIKEALELNRLQESTLKIMWETIEASQHIFIDFLDCKARLIDQDHLHWYDLLSQVSQHPKQAISYEKASTFIAESFHLFSPKLSIFAKQALENHWIDAESRRGKSPGGFCTAFPIDKESRIFMTYSNTYSSLFTLAHELGHAFHHSLLFSLPEMAQCCPMTLAETSSTMSETFVIQAAIKTASSNKEKIFLLDNHLSRAVSYLLNIRARFLFERDFYQERKKGFVSADRLCALMRRAQETSYQKSLNRYHPLFWITKPHFFLTKLPFYNFPYTFGYLFSLGIYAVGSKLPDFEKRYISLLKDTGQISPESLAKKHLDIDLQEPFFWESALNVLKKDFSLFYSLAFPSSELLSKK